MDTLQENLFQYEKRLYCTEHFPEIYKYFNNWYFTSLQFRASFDPLNTAGFQFYTLSVIFPMVPKVTWKCKVPIIPEKVAAPNQTIYCFAILQNSRCNEKLCYPTSHALFECLLFVFTHQNSSKDKQKRAWHQTFSMVLRVKTDYENLRLWHCHKIWKLILLGEHFIQINAG